MQLGPYRLLSRIGHGGMGEVWKAEDTDLLRTVAVKLLKEEMASDAEWKARFLREARTVARLSHPNIATIYAVGEVGTRMYIAMELVEGDSLKVLIAARTLKMPDVTRIIKRCADALAEAHSQGIIHRDVKPENIVVTRRGVKMLDFGIAKVLDAPPEDAGKLTSDGTVIGTPDYMSPEQALGRTIDHRSDIFSLGVVLYETLSGQHPFASASVTETLVRIVTREPLALATLVPDAPPQLVEIVEKALNKKPSERFETAKQMASALNKVYPTSSSAMFPVAERNSPTMPITPTPEPMPAAPLPPPAPPPPKPAKRSSGRLRAVNPDWRVLVADDDPEVRKQLGEVLAQHRLPYDEAANGSEAIQQLKKRKYVLAFIDLMMPRIDGWAVVDFIRGHAEHRGTKTYVVAAGEQRLSTADQDVVSGVVSKPFDPAKLDLLLRNFMKSAS
ncbi:MAG TPA: serine/threonine-protein kinase [Thermoanaerobaculia bacterium]|nr:serine/threonine-protein kinase [Thermoanaerobaculia bacterium]